MTDENTQDVNSESSAENVSEHEQTQEQETQTPEASQTGEKTPPENLHAALKEERQLRKEAERRAREAEENAKELSETQLPDDTDLDSKVSRVEKELASIKEKSLLDSAIEKYPVLKDKLEDFDEYRQDYPVQKLLTVAKMFVHEKELLEQPKERKGLEKPTGGRQQPSIDGKLSPDDISTLRNTNWRKYIKLVKEGKIKV